MSDDMVERIARAIYKTCPDPDIGWDEAGDTIKRVPRMHARAAIAAMREPTAAMVDVGAACFPYGNRNAATTPWQAMIDAALVSERGAEE